MRNENRAFTLIELLLVIVIMAIITVGFALSMQKSTLKSTFDDQVLNIRRIIEKTRDYSLSNYLVNDDLDAPAEYFRLSLATNSASVVAVAANGDEESLDSYVFQSGFAMGSELEVYYFPPYGEVCFSSDCSDVLPEASTIFKDADDTYEAEITINTYGGYPDIVVTATE